MNSTHQSWRSMSTRFSCSRIRALVVIVFVVAMIGFGSSSASAQPAPVITFDGSTGPVNVVASNDVLHLVSGSGFTPNAQPIFSYYEGASCSDFLIFDGERPSDASGNVALDFVSAFAGTYSMQMLDLANGLSNCVDVIVTAPPGAPTNTPEPTATSDGTLEPTPTESCNVTLADVLNFAQDVSCETAVASPVVPTVTPPPPVISLPSTGVGESSTVPQFFLILMLSVAMIAIGTIGWRRRSQ